MRQEHSSSCCVIHFIRQCVGMAQGFLGDFALYGKTCCSHFLSLNPPQHNTRVWVRLCHGFYVRLVMPCIAVYLPCGLVDF